MKLDQNLKSVLALKVRKLYSFIALVGRGFLDLNNFLIFDNFSYFSINLLQLLIPPTTLTVSTLLAISTYNDTIVFSIDVSDAAILLKS